MEILQIKDVIFPLLGTVSFLKIIVSCFAVSNLLGLDTMLVLF